MQQMTTNVECRLCNNEATITFKGHPGYLEGQQYDIVHCSYCGSAYSLPLEIDSRLYETIYSNAANIPGYDRYARYASRVLLEEDPLKYLMHTEDVYWSIGDYLERELHGQNLNILEIGCGRGYLTYAIARKGYNITGLDISKTAIEEATRQYGPHYVCDDIFEYSKKFNSKYDLIIMTEVMEHVPDVKAFMTAAASMLKNSGTLLVTTPNRSVFHKTYLWQTELPPVHLWWFSEESMKYIADCLDLSLTFTDFSRFTKINPQKLRFAISILQPTHGPILKASGHVFSKKEKKALLKPYRGPLFNIVIIKLANLYLRYVKDITGNGKRRRILCAAMKKI